VPHIPTGTSTYFAGEYAINVEMLILPM
jgi:hypothetical protein